MRHAAATDLGAGRIVPVVMRCLLSCLLFFFPLYSGVAADWSDEVVYFVLIDRYADGVKEGMQLKRGDLLGYVGVSGNSDPNAPHLHFAVFALTPEKQWWKGTPVNPYPLLGD